MFKTFQFRATLLDSFLAKKFFIYLFNTKNQAHGQLGIPAIVSGLSLKVKFSEKEKVRV
ncbi:hypothetical protein HYW42_01455 [Candidatus Daviesbacteria bacterium]|nr:hypothetical protein [Candidatus Daviesbacteria bacterium]